MNRLAKPIVLLLALFMFVTPTAFVARSYAEPSASPSSSSACITFEDLTLGTVFGVPNTFTSNSITINAIPFEWSDGTVIGTGSATVENGGSAGGSGNEMNTNNINLDFALSAAFSTGVEFDFGEFGGNLNIAVNGDFRNFNNYQDINGMTIGGALVTVSNGFGNDQGVVRLNGAVMSLVVGGQEHFIDNVCPVPDHQDGAPDLGDAPDSRNHAGTTMTTYGGTVTAEFP
ncbi:MAG TPA: hypothetical protein ENJ56_03340, partial [Anaerolineae bacterium]|nr:hypothetical protein [Anaerolineae bacterium]